MYRVRQPRRPRVPAMKKFVCTFDDCQRRYYERRHLLEHQYLKHGRPRPCRDAPGKLSVWLPTGARRQIESSEIDPALLPSPDDYNIYLDTENSAQEVDEDGSLNESDSFQETPSYTNNVQERQESTIVFNEPTPVIISGTGDTE